MIEKEALIYLLLIHFGQVIRNKYRTFLIVYLIWIKEILKLYLMKQKINLKTQ